MDKQSKYLVIIFVIIILISVLLTYKRSFIDKNFELIGEEEVVE